MAVFTIFTMVECDEMIAEYKKGIKAVATNKPYTITGRTYTRENLGKLEADLQLWMVRRRDAGGGIRVRLVVP